MVKSTSQTSMEHDVVNVPPWRATYWKHIPFLNVLYLIGAVGAAFGSLVVLHLANGQPVEEWKTPPSVYLSILTLLARSLAEGAFKSGADIFWWGQLLSGRGAKLSDLHHTWEFAREKLPLFKRHRPWNRVRSAALSVLVLNAAGPLLQRSVTVEQVTQTSQQLATLPVRIEPMWNLTVLNTNNDNGWSWSTPMYQPEFANIALDHTHRRPPVLAGGSFCEGNCTVNVTVAGFARSCTEHQSSSRDLPNLQPAQHMLVWDRTEPTMTKESCLDFVSFNSSDSIPVRFKTYYQLAVELEPADQATLLYTSYVRSDARSDSLLVQRCSFSTAFLTMTIDIANDSSVALSTRYGLPQDRIVTPISAPTKFEGGSKYILGGFLQVMRDAYEGYVIWDIVEESNVVLGSGPRLYAETVDLAQPVVNSSLAVAFRSPLVDFTNTLNEMALRYALADIPDANTARVHGNDGYIAVYGDVRNVSFPTTIMASKSQSAVLAQVRSVSVFRVNYAYAIAASCVVLVAAIATTPLLLGWWHAGRDFSVSPLEVAKAFDAPLLVGVASGAPVKTIVHVRGDIEVRYGEVLAHDHSPTYSEGGIDDEQATMIPGDTEGEGLRRRLMIERAEKVVSPQNGVKYTM